jgi:glycerophosphoryl diester phosphodiesterase
MAFHLPSSLCLVTLVLALGQAGQVTALPLNVGHRGYSAANPENTLIAIENAFVAGADITEIDLMYSSDGEVMVIHDTTLDRTTNGSGPVGAMTAAQLQTLDAGSWFAPEFAGEQIPTLVEALTLQQTLGAGPLLLDQKAGLLFGPEIVAALAITGASAVDDIMVTAWDLAQVADIRAVLPNTQILWTANSAVGIVIPDLLAAGVNGISVILETYPQVPGIIDDLHAAGMAAFAWNLDILLPETEAKMQQSIDWGLDGYIVNDPQLFASILVPEPATAMLVALGFAMFATRRRVGVR